MRERQRVAQLAQQAQFELPQDRRLRRTCGQAAERILVVAKQPRVRVLARQQLEQQLVQIEAAQQRRPGHQRQATTPLGTNQRLQLAAARPGQRQRLERLQHTAQLGARALRTPRNQRDATVPGGQRFDDQARLAIGEGMEHERLLIVAPFALLSHRQ